MLTFGIIGAGMIAEKHIAAFRKTGKANFKWVSRQNTSLLRDFQSKYEIPEGTGDYKDILSDPEVEVVIIATPPTLHLEPLNDSLKAGKHVILEKPAGFNPQELKEITALEKQYSNLVTCDCSSRHSRLQPKFKKAKEIIESGKLGEIYQIHHNSIGRNGRPGIEYHPEAKWFMDKSKAGGGPLFDWGVYDLSFHLGILGDEPQLKNVKHVTLKSGLDNFNPGEYVYDVEEHFSALLEFDNGIDFYWERGNHANMEVPNETRIYGTKGGLKFGYCSWDDPVITFYGTDKNNTSYTEEIDSGSAGHDDDFAFAENCMAALAGEAAPAMPLHLAAKHLDIIFRCYQKAD